MKLIAKDLPTKLKLMQENFLDLVDETKGTEAEKKTAVVKSLDTNETIEFMRKTAFVEYNKRRTAASSNLAAPWGLIMGQCSSALQQHIKAEEGYDQNQYNPIWLLKTVKKVISGVTHQSNRCHSAFHALKDLFKMRQRRDESVEDYFRRFEASVDLINLSHTKVLDTADLLQVEVKDDPKVTVTDIEQRFLAMAFVENACTIRFSGLREQLSNEVAMKTDKYPKTLAEATYLLTHYKSSAVQVRRSGNMSDDRNQLSFMQRFQGEPIVCPEIESNKNADGTVRGTDGNTHSHIQCTNCGWKGHYAPKCPAPRQDRRGRCDVGYFTFNQANLCGLPPSVIIIDTGSTFNFLQ